MQPKTNQLVQLLCRLSFLFLAFTVFALGLQARLSLYKTAPDISISSAKLNTENRSAQVLKTIAAPHDDRLSGPQLVFKMLLGARCHESVSPVITARECNRVCKPTRLQLRLVSTLRRPPPPSFL